MKCKKITTFLGLFSLCMAASAQNDGLSSQLQGGFDQVWKADSVGNGAIPGNYLRPGTQPQGWEASNVHQKVLLTVKQELVFPDTDRTDAEGFSVKMVNTSVGALGITSPAPAYITWGGTPWVYAVSDLKSCDGGTVGGRNFTFRPDSIVGYYKHTLDGESTEPAKIILYSWKGSFTSEVKTNPNGSLSSSSTAQVTDQDLAVLGKITEGVTKSEDAELIATCEYDLTEPLAEWTRISAPITYHSDNAPEKMTVILSASNYWTRADIHPNNILWADDVMLVYNSRLSSLTIDGVALAGFSKDVYTYEVEGLLPSLDQVEAVADGVGATVETSLEGNVLTVTVKGNDYSVNPENIHTYQITYILPDPVYAEYQLPNADFEAGWTLNQYESAMGTGISYSEETPDYWNSFYRADGDYADAALKLFSNQAGSVKQTVGYDGTGSAALIFSRKNMMNTVSNGNLTSGIVHMGSMTASDAQNYNYSDLDNPIGRCEFVGLPDSVSVYFLFQPVDASQGNASMNMILHSEYEYKDPSTIMGAEDSLKYLVAHATASIEGSEAWTRYTVPFQYNGDTYQSEGKRYLLTSFSTNALPGKGSDGDSLSIDRIRLVYNSRLSSLTIDGSSLAGFSKDVYTYEVEGLIPALDQVEAVADGIGATVETSLEGTVLTVTVKGNDYAANPENVHTYQITYILPDPVYAEYQLPNADFEDGWTLNQYESAMGTGISYSEETPDSWNSFYRADGDYADAALKLFSNQAGSVKQTVGYDGTGSAALIFSRKNMMNTVSNGNLTSGIVHMGSMTASDAQNYNYSDLDNPIGHCEFVGLPDSVSVYFLFQPVDASQGNASMNMILHSEYEYKDPSTIMGAEDSLKYLVARATASIEGSEAWTRYTVPFQYNGDTYQSEGKRYLLTSFSTNALPGKGSDGDSLSIDRIRLVYNSRLSSLTVGGVSLAGFSKDVYTYEVEGDAPALDQVEAVADGIGATVETSLEDNVLTVTVKGNDYAVNPENVHTYQVTYTGNPNGISQTGLQNVKVVYADGQLLVSHADGHLVEVYTMQGVLADNFVADGSPRRVNLSRHSVFVVKVGAFITRILTE